MAKWKTVKLGDVCNVERGGSPRPIDNFITEDDGGVNWIKIGDASDDSMYIRKTKQKITLEGMKKSRYVQPGDFLLSNSMSFGRPYILKIDGCIHDGWLVLRDKNNHFHKEYLYYALSSKSAYRKFKSLAVGGVVNNLNSNIVKRVLIPLPPLETQKQIAKNLDTAAELLAMYKQQLAELDNLIKSIFYNMFGDPVTNEKGWEIKSLKEVCIRITDGTHNSPENYEEGQYKYITAKNIKRDGLDLGDITYVNESAHRQIYSRCNPEFGDILYIKDGVTTGIAQLNTLHEEFSLLSSVALLKHNRVIIVNLFLREVLNNESMYACIRKDMGGAAISRLTIKKIDLIRIPVPPITLQNQFASIVAKIEEQKTLVKKAIDEAQYLFDCLMSEYFE